MECLRCGSENPVGNRFCGDCGSALPTDAARAGRRWGGPRAPDRRQLTVMFCDLVGSTELSTRLDPEEVRELNRSYREACAAIVERYGGLIASYMGDGIMVYFGYPQAHEDNAERAIRAGLDVVRSVRELEPLPGVSLHMRVGVATGRVVAGDLVGDGIREAHAVSGETPNLAARMQELADPDTVVVDAQTRRLAGGPFELAQLGDRQVKGIASPVSCWRVVGERRAASRFDAAHETGISEFVGRQREMDLLLERWQRAEDGGGQVLLVSGEAGIGKSRMVEALRERIAGRPHLSLRYQCSPYHTTSSLHPVIARLERMAEFAPEDAPEQKLFKLGALLARDDGAGEGLVSRLAALLSLPAGERQVPREATPQQQKEELLEAFVAYLVQLASSQPMLIVFEDVHWIDPTTLELLDRTVDRIRGARVLLVATSRPDFEPRWVGLPHVTSVALGSLGRDECVSLVRMVTKGKKLPREVLARIVDKTDGVPLFVEELTKAVIESSVLREASDGYVLTGPLADPAIPSTLQDSLEARLDRLGGAKAVAQIGAVIGREFPYALLESVSPLPDHAVREALDRLIRAGLVFRRGTVQRASFAFKHALIRDVAYESLLRSERHDLHARIASLLESRFPDQAQPEVLAHHYSEAELFDRALTHWQRAGRRAAERSANVEAARHFGRALELVELTTPAGHRRDELELELQIALAGSQIANEGYGSEEVERSFARARELCQKIGETPQRFRVLYGLWLFYFSRARREEAVETAERMFQFAERSGETALRLHAHYVMGTTAFYEGAHRKAQGHLDQALALYDPVAHRSHAVLYGRDPAVLGRIHSGLSLWYSGYPDRGLQRLQAALALARDLEHPLSLGWALIMLGLVHNLRGEPELAEPCVEEGIALARERRLPMLVGAGSVVRAAALGRMGREAIAVAEEAEQIFRDAGSRVFLPQIIASSAEIYQRAKRPERALEKIHEGLRILESALDQFHAPELHRLKGDVLAVLAPQMPERAESCLRTALAIARKQDARSLELRAATSLARLLVRNPRRRTEARELLAPVSDSFDEGLDLPDWGRAQRVLDELRA